MFANTATSVHLNGTANGEGGQWKETDEMANKNERRRRAGENHGNRLPINMSSKELVVRENAKGMLSWHGKTTKKDNSVFSLVTCHGSYSRFGVAKFRDRMRLQNRWIHQSSEMMLNDLNGEGDSSPALY